MKLAVTPGCKEFVLLIVDTETGEVTPIESCEDQWENQPHSEKSQYWRRFGISWSADTLFVAARHNVLCFDQKLDYLCKVPAILDGNPHQISYYDDELYVCNTAANTISAFDTNWNERIVYDEVADAHFNSLLIDDQMFWVNASRRGNSAAVELYSDVRKHTGQHSHNLGLWDGDLSWIDTNGTGWLTTGFRSCRLFTGDYFCRGLAISDEQLFVGVSYRSRGNHNYDMPCHIQVLDLQGRMQDKIELPGMGPIHDIRLLDVFDYAHLRNPFL